MYKESYLLNIYSFWYVPSWNWIPSFRTYEYFLRRFKISAQQLMIYYRNFLPSRSSAPTLCLSDPVYTFFQVSGTVRSADPTDHGIPDTWKCFSFLIKTLHTPPTHLYWTGFWNDRISTLSQCARIYRSLRTVQGKSAFWNVSVGSALPSILWRRENLLSLTEFKIRFMGFSARRLVNFLTVGVLSYLRLFLI